jgi:hypothetical protein
MAQIRFKKGDLVEFQLPYNPGIFRGEIIQPLNNRCHILATKCNKKKLKNPFEVAVDFRTIVLKKTKLEKKLT